MTAIADRLWKVIDDVECLEENCDKSLTAESEVLREISIELTAIHAELVKEGWQPIETAPEGELVLLWKRPSSVFVGDWRDYRLFNSPKFTHWMPLPQPPASQPEKPNE